MLHFNLYVCLNMDDGSVTCEKKKRSRKMFPDKFQKGHLVLVNIVLTL